MDTSKRTSRRNGIFGWVDFTSNSSANGNMLMNERKWYCRVGVWEIAMLNLKFSLSITFPLSNSYTPTSYLSISLSLLSLTHTHLPTFCPPHLLFGVANNKTSFVRMKKSFSGSSSTDKSDAKFVVNPSAEEEEEGEGGGEEMRLSGTLDGKELWKFEVEGAVYII